MDPENGRIRRFLEEQAAQLDSGARMLDASAGNRPYQPIFGKQLYESCDMPNGFYHCKHDFECFLDEILRPDGYYDAVVMTQVLEHVPNPEQVLRELARVTRPRGKLLLSVPLNGPLHGEPWHFYQYTHHGLGHLAQASGWRMTEGEKIGGAFWLLGKRLAYLPRGLMKAVDPFRARKRGLSPAVCLGLSLAFLPFWLLAIPLLGFLVRPACYWLDRLDLDKSFTSGYTAVFERVA
ncbi:MAG: class I SAM-dependent methyltransferase [Gammaproteobacteria bacterium]|nr:class I SAM-dependent methyltransferase [Gammaproteobacteria bacterium]MBU1656267.1 class I SAM-dependent methyltransferase [Gammaproteobacteria bacterium]MBU1959832.1 class I SAM-dependent methyltransferase [Gammaproteobacteria bacterium]